MDSARLIVQSQVIKSHRGSCDLDKLTTFWAEACQRICSRINSPALDMDEIFAPELELAIQQFSQCAYSYSIIVQIRDRVRKECSALRRTVVLPPISITEQHLC